MKRLRYIMLLAGLMSLSLQTIYAQRITRSFRNTSMSEALTILAKSTKDYRINFMYDELEDFTVTTSIVKRTAPDAIRQIMVFAGVHILRYRQSSLFVFVPKFMSPKM